MCIERQPASKFKNISGVMHQMQYAIKSNTSHMVLLGMMNALSAKLLDSSRTVYTSIALSIQPGGSSLVSPKSPWCVVYGQSNHWTAYGSCTNVSHKDCNCSLPILCPRVGLIIVCIQRITCRKPVFFRSAKTSCLRLGTFPCPCIHEISARLIWCWEAFIPSIDLCATVHKKIK